MIMIVRFFSIWLIFVSWFFLTKLPTSGIFFSTAVNAEIVAKPLITGILLSVSVILALQSNFSTS